MKKLKITAAAMAVIMSLNTAQVFAAVTTAQITQPTQAEETAELALTLETATAMAIKNSTTIKELNNNKASNDEKADNARDTLFSSGASAAYINYTITMNGLKFDEAVNEQNIVLREKLIAQLVSQGFVSIILAEDSYDEYLANMEIQKKNFNITEVKKQLGMISELDYTSAKQSYDDIVASEDSYKQTITDAYVSLNRIIGEDADKRYELAYDITYEELGSVDLSHQIYLAEDVDTTIKTKQETISSNDYALETYTRRNVNDATGEILDSSTSRESYQRSSSQLSLEISDRRAAIEDGVTSAYNAIIEQEKQYRELTTALANAKKEYEVKKVEMELGKITQLELDTLAYDILTQENVIKNLVYEHAKAITTFTDANLLSNSIQSA